MLRFHYPASYDEFDDGCDLDAILHPAQLFFLWRLVPPQASALLNPAPPHPSGARPWPIRLGSSLVGQANVVFDDCSSWPGDRAPQARSRWDASMPPQWRTPLLDCRGDSPFRRATGAPASFRHAAAIAHGRRVSRSP
jgi:hypothetical protein